MLTLHPESHGSNSLPPTGTPGSSPLAAQGRPRLLSQQLGAAPLSPCRPHLEEGVCFLSWRSLGLSNGAPTRSRAAVEATF